MLYFWTMKGIWDTFMEGLFGLDQFVHLNNLLCLGRWEDLSDLWCGSNEPTGSPESSICLQVNPSVVYYSVNATGSVANKLYGLKKLPVAEI